MTDLSKFKVAKAFRHLNAQHGLLDDVSSGFSSIRYKGKVWTLQFAGEQYPFKRDDDDSPLTYIDLIVLGIGAGTSKVFFGDGEWNEDSATSPVCASARGDVPDPGVPVPQSKSCGICKNNEWGSKPGSKGRACQDYKKLAVLLTPAMTGKMLKTPLLEPVFLKIPPFSFRPMKAYFDELTHAGIPFQSVVTRIAFSSEKTFQMTFKLQQSLTDAEAPLVLPMMESSQTRQIIGDMSQVREIAPPAEAEKVETGLLAAFSAVPAEDKQAAAPVTRRGPGRPPKAKPEEAVETDVPSDPLAKAAPAAAQPVDGENYDESDTDLDASVAKVVGDKLKNMLPSRK